MPKFKQGDTVIHIKKGGIYTIFTARQRDCTQNRDLLGYGYTDSNGEYFFREHAEMDAKFEILNKEQGTTVIINNFSRQPNQIQIGNNNTMTVSQAIDAFTNFPIRKEKQ